MRRGLLDEPTDNLDFESAEALEQALDRFEGAVVTVTHDRWFARAFERFLVFEADGRVRGSDAPVWDAGFVRRARCSGGSRDADCPAPRPARLRTGRETRHPERVDEAAARVLAVRAEAERAVAELDRRIGDVVAARADANSDDEHDPEGATLAFERSQADALRAAARQRVIAADAALERLRTGSYGVCAVCGEPIPAGRLAARPLTDRCVRHA